MNSKQLKTVRWLLPVSAGLYFFIGFEAGALQFVLLGVTDEFALHGAMIGVLLAIQYFALMIGQPVFGFIADRVGKKPIIIMAMSMFIVGCATLAGASVIHVFIIGVFLAGMGYGITEALVCAALVDVYLEKAERYTNLSQSLFSLGAVVGPLAASWISVVVNTRLAFLIAVVGYIALLPFFASTPLPRLQQASEKPKFSLRGGAAIPFAILLFTIFVYGGMETSAAGFFNSLFSQALSATELGAYAISVYWLTMMLSRVLFGLLHLPARWVVLICIIGCSLTFVVLSISQTPMLSLLFCALAGVASGPIWAMLVSFAAKEFPAFSGMVVSLMSTCSGLGATLIPIAVGWTANNFSLHIAMLMIAVTVLISAFIFTGYLKRVRH